MDLRYEPSIYLFERKRVIDWRLIFLADQSLLRDPRLAKLKNASLFSVTGVLQAAYLQHQNASFFVTGILQMFCQRPGQWIRNVLPKLQLPFETGSFRSQTARRSSPLLC